MIPAEMLRLAAEKGMESAALDSKIGDIPTFADKSFSDVGSDGPRIGKDSNIPKFAENDADASDGQDEAAPETSERGDSNETAGQQEANSTLNDCTGDSADNAENLDPQTDSDAEEQLGLTDEEKARIKEETGWSDAIIDHIDSIDQYEIYKNADLAEREINGRPCLCKKIDMDYVDPKTGMTNRERISRGLVPIDAKTGERIELHHMGQDPDGPFAELCENSEHGDGNHKTLHPKSEGSWRDDNEKVKAFEQQKHKHWAERAQEGV